jgi:tetrahydromethanopterin S-methyltransferase subunit D
VRNHQESKQKRECICIANALGDELAAAMTNLIGRRCDFFGVEVIPGREGCRHKWLKGTSKGPLLTRTFTSSELDTLLRVSHIYTHIERVGVTDKILKK